MSIETQSRRLKGILNHLDPATHYFLVLTGFFVPLSITGTDICMALTAALGVISGRFLQHFAALKRSPLVWCTLWIVLLVVLAMTWSIAPWADRLSALHKYSKLLYIPLLLVVCTDPKWRDRTIQAFLLGVLVIVILSYLKAFCGLHIGSNPNPAFIFYTHIETSFLVAFAAYLAAVYAWKNPRWRIGYIILVVLFSYQEFFINDGRTGWVAYLVLLILFAIQFTGWKGVLVGCAVALMMVVGFYYVSPTFKNMIGESVVEIEQYKQGHVETSLGYRLSFDSLSWRLVKERPILGYGTGSFATTYQLSGGVPGWQTLRTPHNEYLMVLVEFGLVGLISLLMLFFIQLRLSFQLGEMMFFAQGLVLVFMMSSCYNAFLYLSVSGHFYMLFTALFYGHLLHAKDRISSPG